jgi:hypothetical protein
MFPHDRTCPYELPAEHDALRGGPALQRVTRSTHLVVAPTNES